MLYLVMLLSIVKVAFSAPLSSCFSQVQCFNLDVSEAAESAENGNPQWELCLEFDNSLDFCVKEDDISHACPAGGDGLADEEDKIEGVPTGTRLCDTIECGTYTQFAIKDGRSCMTEQVLLANFSIPDYDKRVSCASGGSCNGGKQTKACNWTIHAPDCPLDTSTVAPIDTTIITTDVDDCVPPFLPGVCMYNNGYCDNICGCIEDADGNCVDDITITTTSVDDCVPPFMGLCEYAPAPCEDYCGCEVNGMGNCVNSCPYAELPACSDLNEQLDENPSICGACGCGFDSNGFCVDAALATIPSKAMAVYERSLGENQNYIIPDDVLAEEEENTETYDDTVVTDTDVDGTGTDGTATDGTSTGNTENSGAVFMMKYVMMAVAGLVMMGQ